MDASRLHLLLIGPRASGKSTVGPRLAGRLGLPFADLDDDALAASGRTSVREVFAADGEPVWRQLETRCLLAWIAGPAGILALGGGAPVHPPITAAIEAMRERGTGWVVLLDVSEAELVRRLAADTGDRPGLLGDDPVAEVRALLERRRPVYAALADVVVDAAGPPDAVAGEIARAISRG